MAEADILLKNLQEEKMHLATEVRVPLTSYIFGINKYRILGYCDGDLCILCKLLGIHCKTFRHFWNLQDRTIICSSADDS